jgi:hypothetical protein
VSGASAPPATRSRRDIFGPLTAGHLTVFFLLLFPAASGLRGKIGDYDLWWHLAAGRWIVEHRAVPTTDVFSYTAAGHPWIAYSWLAEVLFHGLVRQFGLAALLWLQAIVAVLIVGFVYLACRAAGADRNAAVLTSACAALGSSFAWGIRPVVFTLLFFAVLVLALARESGERRLLWLAPAVVAVWANLHVLFVGGVALVAFAALCRTIEGRPSRHLWIAAALSLAAALANPYGWHLFQEVWTMARQPSVAPEVGEFQSPDFRGELALPFFAFLLPSVIVLALSRERLTLFELGTYLGSLALGLAMQRNLALFAILGAPAVARRLGGLLPAPPSGREGHEQGVPLRILNVSLLAWGLLYAASVAPRSSRWPDVVEAGSFPVAATDFVAARYPGARLFNDFDWGGYLIYRLHPSNRVSIDGRTQVYENVLRGYMRTWFLEPGWERFLEECDADVVVWPVAAPLTSVLRLLPQWQVVFEDSAAVVFRRVRGPSPA